MRLAKRGDQQGRDPSAGERDASGVSSGPKAARDQQITDAQGAEGHSHDPGIGCSLCRELAYRVANRAVRSRLEAGCHEEPADQQRWGGRGRHHRPPRNPLCSSGSTSTYLCGNTFARRDAPVESVVPLLARGQKLHVHAQDLSTPCGRTRLGAPHQPSNRSDRRAHLDSGQRRPHVLIGREF